MGQANSNSWVRTYTKDDGTKYQTAFRTNTVWAEEQGGKPTPGSFTTNLQVDKIAIDKGITGGGTAATWSTGASRGPGSNGIWDRKYVDAGDTTQGFFIPDKGWDDLMDRTSDFNSQVNNNTAAALAKRFNGEGYGRTFGMDSKAGAMKEILRSQGTGNQGNASSTAPSGNRFRTTNLNEQLTQADGTRERYGTDGRNAEPLVYPTALKTNRTQDKLQVRVLKYEPRDTQEGRMYALKERSQRRNKIGEVWLPVPGGVGDNNSVSWGEDTMNPAQLAVANATFNVLKGKSFDQTGKEITDTLQNAGGQDKADVKTGLAAIFTQAATNTKILTRKTGAVVNPNMELLFGGPSLRPFAFTYRLSPRDRGESIICKKIIRLFKQSMAVQRTKSQLFLKSPNTYQLRWIDGQKQSDHDFLPRIKECALTGFNVNYTPDGNYATYDDSSMVSYEIQFAFQELEPVYNDDYGKMDNNSDQSIGY